MCDKWRYCSRKAFLCGFTRENKIVTERAGSVLCAAIGAYMRHYIARSAGSGNCASVLELLKNSLSWAFSRQNHHLPSAEKQ
jgi:hypothetical protein